MITLFTITYRPEWTPSGWVIWRGDSRLRSETALRGPRPVTAAQRDAEIVRAQQKDRAACTRLGLSPAKTGENGRDLAIMVDRKEIGS